jgi:hypothetical protein
MKKQDNVIKKKCTRCDDFKKIDEFNKDKNGNLGLKASCKSCISIYSKKYGIKNKDKISQYNKIYRKNNKETIDKKIQMYQINNKEKLYSRNTKYHFEKYNNDPLFKLKRLLRDRIYKTLVNKNVTSKTLKLLGCSVKEFKLYLEKQFLPEMNWENHGEIWELDHIKPCASFNLINEEEQEQCFYFFNYQPLFKTTEIAEKFGYIDQIGNRNKSKKYE